VDQQGDPDELSDVPGEQSAAEDSSDEDHCSEESADDEGIEASYSLSQEIMKEDFDFSPQFSNSTLEPGPSKEELREEEERERAAAEEAAEAIESKRVSNAWGLLLGKKVKIVENRVDSRQCGLPARNQMALCHRFCWRMGK
jgi:hypothetical protein